MKILYLAHRIPFPPDKGEKIRAYHQIRHLARRHDVHLGCLVDDPADRDHARELSALCRSVDSVYRAGSAARIAAGLALFGRRSLSVASFRSRRLAALIRERIRRVSPDLIFVYSSSMASYVIDVAGIARVMDFVDVDSEKWRQYAERHRPPLSWVYRTEAARLARWEERVARSFDHSLIITERESRLLRERVGDRPLSVLSNGVDLDFFRPVGSTAADPAPILVFTGVMDYYPNVDGVSWFCREVLPLVRREVPEVRFHIVGKNPSRAVAELAGDGVVVTGAVPDIRPWLTEAAVSVAPLRIARGLQNKVLEAMAMGSPVVTAPEVLESIGAGDDDGVRGAADAERFAHEVVVLLRDPALRRRRSARARRHVEVRHRWETLGERLEEIVGRVVAERAA